MPSNHQSLSNRDFLVALIYSKTGAFTVRQIKDEYKKSRNTLCIDGGESIETFINGLVELGGLRDHFGKYTVATLETNVVPHHAHDAIPLHA